MTGSEWERAWALFDVARVAPRDQREELLRVRCADDAIRTRVRRWLEAHDADPEFMSAPAPAQIQVLDDAHYARLLIGRTAGPYQIVALLGLGAMGAVYEARQGHPDRVVALKVLRGAPFGPRDLRRFRQEVAALARLEHPGIARIYDAGTLGVAFDQVPFLTLELVRGDDLVTHADVRGLTARQRIALLARVCDAVQGAHERAIIHRDLKPANILVDAAGNPKIVDFGIAKILDDDVPGGTLTGHVIGTPPYMSPEQESGDPSRLSTRADIFSLGVIGHRLLTGEFPPHLRRTPSPDEPPKPRPAGPHFRSVLEGDAGTVLRKAMSEDPDERYPSAAHLAADLRRILHDEPILAHPPSTLYVFRKLLRRRTKTVVAALSVLASMVVATGVSVHWARREHAALQHAGLLASNRELATLKAEGPGAWPLMPSSIPGLVSWLDRASALVTRLPELRVALAEVRERALAPNADDVLRDDAKRAAMARHVSQSRDHVERFVLDVLPQHGRDHARLMGQTSLRRDVECLEQRLVAQEQRLVDLGGRRLTYRYDVPADEWLEDELTRLIDDLERFTWPKPTNAPTHNIASVTAGLEYARQLELRTVTERSDDWQRVIRSIRDRSSPYAGLTLAPIVGLVPLGPDPVTSFQEFAHVPSGFPAVRDPDTGELVLDPSNGIVLVLLPGGTACRGASASARDDRCVHLDPDASRDEGPPNHVELAPFLISKYETTQRQWANLLAGSVSRFDMYNDLGEDGPHITGRHPIESVTWEDASEAARRYALRLPTEAQWEYAARAGTRTPWWCDSSALMHHENLADRAYAEWLGTAAACAEPWRDGHTIHAPVGSFASNGFGLHDMLGNVREWTLDPFVFYTAHGVAPGTGAILAESGGDRSIRGGSFRTTAVLARCSLRKGLQRTDAYDDLGVRFVLNLDGTPRSDR